MKLPQWFCKMFHGKYVVYCPRCEWVKPYWIKERVPHNTEPSANEKLTEENHVLTKEARAYILDCDCELCKSRRLDSVKRAGANDDH